MGVDRLLSENPSVHFDPGSTVLTEESANSGARSESTTGLARVQRTRSFERPLSPLAGGCVKTPIKFPKLISVVSEREMQHEAIHRRRIP